MSDYDISPEARAEVRDIWDYIARDNEEAADRWVIRLLEVFDLLARNPRIGHRREDFTDPLLLFWPVEKFLIVYREIANGNIEIIAVTRGGRDIPSWLRNRS